MTYLVGSDAALARIVGVSRSAIQKAERWGKIERLEDGRWDVLDVVRCWRENTRWLLQRPKRAREFRPWIDCTIPLRGSVFVELCRRARAEGVEKAGYDDDVDFSEEDDDLEDDDLDDLSDDADG